MGGSRAMERGAGLFGIVACLLLVGCTDPAPTGPPDPPGGADVEAQNDPRPREVPARSVACPGAPWKMASARPDGTPAGAPLLRLESPVDASWAAELVDRCRARFGTARQCAAPIGEAALAEGLQDCIAAGGSHCEAGQLLSADTARCVAQGHGVEFDGVWLEVSFLARKGGEVLWLFSDDRPGCVCPDVEASRSVFAVDAVYGELVVLESFSYCSCAANGSRGTG